MIGKEIRIAQKLYKVNMKNGKGLQEKFEKNPDAPTEGNEKTILEIPKAIKGMFYDEQVNDMNTGVMEWYCVSIYWFCFRRGIIIRGGPQRVLLPHCQL